MWPSVVERAVEYLRQHIAPEPPTLPPLPHINAAEELVGEQRLRELEARQRWLAAQIQNVDDEIQAILGEHRRRG